MITNEVLQNQKDRKFAAMSERDKEIQGSIWALLFLVAETALSFRVLRDTLMSRGALLPEDEQIINRAASLESNLQAAYEHVERAFQEKYKMVHYAMDNPEEVNAAMGADTPNPEEIDLNG